MPKKNINIMLAFRWINLLGLMGKQSYGNLEVYLKPSLFQMMHYGYPPREDYGEQAFPLGRGGTHHRVYSVLS